MKIYKEDDSLFSTVLTSAKGDLLVTSTINFDGNYASNALWELLNFKQLGRRDKLTIGSLKILSMQMIFNNKYMNDFEKLLAA
jgi:hypothetical protein